MDLLITALVLKFQMFGMFHISKDYSDIIQNMQRERPKLVCMDAILLTQILDVMNESGILQVKKYIIVLNVFSCFAKCLLDCTGLEWRSEAVDFDLANIALALVDQSKSFLCPCQLWIT